MRSAELFIKIDGKPVTAHVEYDDETLAFEIYSDDGEGALMYTEETAPKRIREEIEWRLYHRRAG